MTFSIHIINTTVRLNSFFFIKFLWAKKGDECSARLHGVFLAHPIDFDQFVHITIVRQLRCGGTMDFASWRHQGVTLSDCDVMYHGMLSNWQMYYGWLYKGSSHLGKWQMPFGQDFAKRKQECYSYESVCIIGGKFNLFFKEMAKWQTLADEFHLPTSPRYSSYV